MFAKAYVRQRPHFSRTFAPCFVSSDDGQPVKVVSPALQGFHGSTPSDYPVECLAHFCFCRVNRSFRQLHGSFPND